jgi:hypothetical protein
LSQATLAKTFAINLAGFELTLTHHMDPKWADYADRVASGWTKMLDALAGVEG